ncbi:unnamed protein product, partial [Brenthis ino]
MRVAIRTFWNLLSGSMNRFRRCSFRLGLLAADILEPDTGLRMQTRRFKLGQWFSYGNRRLFPRNCAKTRSSWCGMQVCPSFKLLRDNDSA